MKFRDRVVYRCLTGCMALLGHIPFSRFDALGNFFGSMWFVLDKKHRARAVQNIRKAYGPDITEVEAQELARRVFQNFARVVFEHAWFCRLPVDKYPGFFKLKGMDNLKSAYSKGRGVICISGHLGNWEIALAANKMTGLPFCAVYKKIKNRAVDRYILERRSCTGFELIQTHGAFGRIKRYLENGYVAGLLIDQNVPRSKGIFVEFFGRLACTNKSVAKLALDTGAPVVPLFIYREGGKFVIEMLPEVPLSRTGDETADILENTQAFARIVENFVRKYPDQWFWLHNRWRTKPVTDREKNRRDGVQGPDRKTENNRGVN